MKTIDLATGHPSLADLLQLAREGNLILRAGDGKEYLLAEVDELDREVALVRQQTELMALLDERSRSTSTLSLSQARAALGID
jgi:hypothetical protein